jgi:hypothetical protein
LKVIGGKRKDKEENSVKNRQEVPDAADHARSRDDRQRDGEIPQGVLSG